MSRLPSQDRPWAVSPETDRSARVKTGLYNAACFGWSKPLPGSPARLDLDRFLDPGSPDHDPVFAQDLSAARPSWCDGSQGNELAGAQRAIGFAGIDDDSAGAAAPAP